MINQPINPEHVRIVHDRQVLEITRRRELARLAGPGFLPVLRRIAGVALIRAGRAIGGQTAPIAPVVPGRPGVRTT